MSVGGAGDVERPEWLFVYQVSDGEESRTVALSAKDASFLMGCARHIGMAPLHLLEPTAPRSQSPVMVRLEKCAVARVVEWWSRQHAEVESA